MMSRILCLILAKLTKLSSEELPSHTGIQTICNTFRGDRKQNISKNAEPEFTSVRHIRK